jgi:hypothetical protein
MLYVITDTLLKVVFNTNKTGHRQLFCITWRPVLLVLNTTFNNMSVILYNMATSIIGVEHHLQQYVRYNV